MQVAREIELQASLQHPSIVQIYAAFEDNEGIYVVQEFALGGDLYAQLAQAGGYLAEDQVACEVMVPVLSALQYMHGKVSLLNTCMAWSGPQLLVVCLAMETIVVHLCNLCAHSTHPCPPPPPPPLAPCAVALPPSPPQSTPLLPRSPSSRRAMSA